jgi:Spy/CpxP family protein refolding chaperone
VITLRKTTVCLLALAILGCSALSFSATPVWAVATTPSTAPATTQENKPDWAKQRQEWFKHASDHMADRLEIKASQQTAWQAYIKVLESAMQHPTQAVETKSDAASITRLHADMAAARAQKMAQIADATAKFQEVLSPDQRKTFDQIVAHFIHRHAHGFHGSDRAEHGGREHKHWGQHDDRADEGQKHEHEHNHTQD